MKKNVLWMVVGVAVWMYPALAMGQATAASPGSPDPSAQAQPTSAAPEAKVDIACVVRTQKGVPVPGGHGARGAHPQRTRLGGLD